MNSSTPLWQRIFIWGVAIVMLGGTVAGFVFMMLTNNPDLNPDEIAYQRQMEEYEKEYEEYIEEMKKAAEERQKLLRGLEGYENYVTTFDATSVKELTVELLNEGGAIGATVVEGATIAANYTGWQSDGRIFDSTKLVDEEQESIEFSLDQVIDGWSQGLVGTRAGGVYLLTIPATMAYGEGEGIDDSGRPLGPLRFLVHVVEVM